MTCSKRGRCPSDSGVEVDDLDRQPREEVVDDGNCSRSSTVRADEALGEGRRGHRELITATQGAGERGARGFVVGVVSVEQADDDTGVEVDQSHSSRRVLMSCLV